MNAENDAAAPGLDARPTVARALEPGRVQGTPGVVPPVVGSHASAARPAGDPAQERGATALVGSPSGGHRGRDAQTNDANVSDRITVMFATDSRGWLETLLRRLVSEQDMDVVGDPFADLVQFLMALEQRRPRILLIDKGLLDRMGPDALRLIHALSPGTRVLLHWHEVCHDLAPEIARNRFHGMLLTDDQPDACAKAIRAVHRGELWLPRALLASAIFGSVRAPACAGAMMDGDRPHASTGNALTRRQTQIVEHLRQGFTNKEIARKLGIMEDTVKKHLQGVFGRLGVHRRALVVLSEAASRPRPAQDAAELNALRRTPDSRDHLPL